MGKVIVTDALGALPDPLFMLLPQSQLLNLLLSARSCPTLQSTVFDQIILNMPAEYLPETKTLEQG